MIRIVLENELRLPLASVASRQLAALEQQMDERSAISLARDLAGEADAAAVQVETRKLLTPFGIAQCSTPAPST